ncbi:branched-chain amino acid ABC transporter permease [Nocardia speluncae]|uniref:Branched-chain amino acid ABC transporter permease n=1 Tax=Nocardia speluncae TaxID=419477 RepID=A0A846X5U1_9NOCA|nr:branched-chain amino acid ABC transporter permease [Nocardia speluncae]NKY31471.1 branched-chain amino acid ABC transporter permease [Nocardia speluncae]
MLTDIIVPGLTFGSIYALIAMSFNVSYRPTNVVNFAQGELVMVGAMVVAATALGGLPWGLAAVAVMVLVGAIALVEERIAVTPVLRRSSHATGWVITTLAFSLVIGEVAGKLWTDQPRAVEPPAPLSLDRIELAGASFNTYQVAVVVAAVLVMLVLQRIDRTPLGCAMRAVAADRDGARLRGVDPSSLTRQSFFISGALAGLAGLLAAPLLLASLGMGLALLIKGFATLAIGGIGSNKGALLAGWTLGLVEAIGTNYVSPGLQNVVLFAFMLVFLLIRPNGVLGQKVMRHV